MLILNKKTNVDNVFGRNEILEASKFATQLLKNGNYELWWVFEGFLREDGMVIPALFVSDGSTVHFPFKSITGAPQEFILSQNKDDYAEFDSVRCYSIIDFLENWTKS